MILTNGFSSYNIFQVYDSCTYVADQQPWCATQVDENGHLVSNDWGYCTASCPVMPIPVPTLA